MHTDLQPRNILLGVEDESILADFEKEERCNPSPRKINSDYTIYTSRELGIPKQHGRPVLSEFGEARFGQQDYDSHIQPYPYRAPEVILQTRWDSKVDIWNFGMLAWDLFENKHLFNARNEEGEESSLHRLAEMVAILGPPPEHFLNRTEASSQYFTADGQYSLLVEIGHEIDVTYKGEWKGCVEIPTISLETSQQNLEGDSQSSFLQSMKNILQWNPEERKSAKGLLEDPWLKGTESSTW
ncbi:Protein kinase domain-containing protein [Aspergillus sclerotialis]|uniref:Protein kinase domain-containing protein n=1 Tax=Aspergillus sclerotialis TaxID=2070753 RepID=A0A3A2ZJ95_9EURO|nr:Protein kinase domain-containing protein [Aspergillus sclerotialis]